MSGLSGLNDDGGINFKRKRNWDTKKEEPKMFSRKAPDKPDEEPEEEVKEPDVVDPEYEARQARLEAKLVTAKAVNYSGFAINGSSMLVLLVGINNVIMDPSTLELISLIETTFGIDIPYEEFVKFVEIWKTQIMTLCGSMQMFFISYQQTRQRMKDSDREDTWTFINDELDKII